SAAQSSNGKFLADTGLHMLRPLPGVASAGQQDVSPRRPSRLQLVTFAASRSHEEDESNCPTRAVTGSHNQHWQGIPRVSLSILQPCVSETGSMLLWHPEHYDTHHRRTA